jgi:RNA polymerase sigma-70 factor (ECF subfamily)
MNSIGSLTLATTTSRPRLRGAEKDEALIAAIATGDQRAMRILYDRHHVRVFRFATRLVGDAATAEDVVSECFMDVWRQADRFEGRSAVTTWILSIARFKALTARVRRPEVVLDEKVTETVADEADTPEQSALEIDRGVQLRECLKKLTAEHREIVDLVYYHDKTIEEVADIIQAPKNTVKTRMFYARKRLAQLLAQHCDFDRMTAGAAA